MFKKIKKRDGRTLEFDSLKITSAIARAGKQNTLGNGIQFGNFINAPLFAPLVPQGKTVFVDPLTFEMYPNHWDFLESIEKVSEHILDDIIEVNNLSIPQIESQLSESNSANIAQSRFSLPLCAQKILKDGVVQNQRVSCFRLAVHLKRLGLPQDVTVAALKTWALKNRPTNGKGVIRESEILSQTSWAYEKSYVGYGCDDPAIKPFCDPSCPLKRREKHNQETSSEKAENDEGDVPISQDPTTKASGMPG